MVLIQFLQLFVVLLFWVSLAVTEGWKWRMDRGIADSHPIVTDGTYHLWRGATNFAFLVALLMGPMHLPAFVPANIFAWLVYERVISWVECDWLFAPRGSFRLMGKTYPRPNVNLQVGLALLAASTWIVQLLLSISSR